MTCSPVLPHTVFDNGLVLSIQANKDGAYCTPRYTDGPYSTMEVGISREMVNTYGIPTSLIPYQEGGPSAHLYIGGVPGDWDVEDWTVFPYVPVKIILRLMEDLGVQSTPWRKEPLPWEYAL